MFIAAVSTSGLDVHCSSLYFRCETVEEGRLVLHYHSTRTGYYPLVKGLLSAVAREIFNQKIDILFMSSSRALEGEGCDQEHVIFHVIIPPKDLAATRSLDEDKISGRPMSTSDDVIISRFEPVSLNKDQFATAFPYHLIFDEDLRLRQYGRSVARFSPVPLTEGILVTSAFTITYPRISFTVDNICRFINAIFILTVIPQGGAGDVQNPFSMKGQMIWLQDTRQVIFVGSPRLTSLKEMKRMNIYMADIPLYDVTREMVLLYQQRTAEIDITKELDETTAELKRMSRELELEKQGTEKLLYQMLPEKVAIQLKNGKAVEAGESVLCRSSVTVIWQAGESVTVIWQAGESVTVIWQAGESVTVIWQAGESVTVI
ncbi:Guanylate cyclase soluble subunit beta-2 [Bulinus truncatus]|nr:Guanylate cyclase soluble subunit beta-2 [Bulinus truncatus]